MPNLIQYIIQDDPSKKTLSDLAADKTIEVYKKASSGVFRTPKSTISKNWGKGTEAHLNGYLKKDKSSFPKGNESWLTAPFHDFFRNKNSMEADGRIGNDKFFHCKANYEAAKRGKWGELVGKTLSLAREASQNLMGEGAQDYSDDWEANRRGWRGAKTGKNLLESCPRNPRDYYK